MHLIDITNLDLNESYEQVKNELKNYSSKLIDKKELVVLNKVDLVAPDKLKTVKAIIRGLNAKAKIVETTQSKIDLDEVMNTGKFNLEEAQEHPLWAQELYNFNDHVPETEEYGITSFVYRARSPFNPSKIHTFFNQE